mgnify:CR=1 FL=1
MVLIEKESNIDLRKVLEGLGLLDKFCMAKTIAIKPNFASGTYISADSHVVTNLGRIAMLITAIARLNADVKILLCESDSTGYGFAYEKFRHFNLPESLNLEEGILKRLELVDMTRDELILVENESFRYFKGESRKLYLSKKFMEADIRISFANLKTHSVTKYTGACKNLFGCLPDFEKSHYHPYLSNVIHDLVIGICPDMSIVDGFYAMEQNGPCNGIPVDLGRIVYADSAVEADIYASCISGFKVREIGYLKRIIKTKKDCIEIDNKTVPIVKKVVRPQMFLRIMNAVGLFIQRVGQSIASLGHRIHTCNSFIILITTLIRPILLKVFGIDKLREMKRRIIK